MSWWKLSRRLIVTVKGETWAEKIDNCRWPELFLSQTTTEQARVQGYSRASADNFCTIFNPRRVKSFQLRESLLRRQQFRSARVISAQPKRRDDNPHTDDHSADAKSN